MSSRKKIDAAFIALRSAVAAIDRPMTQAEARTHRAAADKAIADFEKLVRAMNPPARLDDGTKAAARELADAVHSTCYRIDAVLGDDRSQAAKLIQERTGYLKVCVQQFRRKCPR